MKSIRNATLGPRVRIQRAGEQRIISGITPLEKLRDGRRNAVIVERAFGIELDPEDVGNRKILNGSDLAWRIHRESRCLWLLDPREVIRDAQREHTVARLVVSECLEQRLVDAGEPESPSTLERDEQHLRRSIELKSSDLSQRDHRGTSCFKRIRSYVRDHDIGCAQADVTVGTGSWGNPSRAVRT